MSEAFVHLYATHPAPWQLKRDQIIDSSGEVIITVDVDEPAEQLFWQGVVEAVNAHAECADG